MRLNNCGGIVLEEWLRSPEIRPGIELDAFAVMPNHFHGIIIMNQPLLGAHGCAPVQPEGNVLHSVRRANAPIPQEAPPHPALSLLNPPPLQRRPKSLGSFIAGFKSIVTKRINLLRHMPGVPVWKRNYYEHVIRNESDLYYVREYVLNNPARWKEDRFYY